MATRPTQGAGKMNGSHGAGAVRLEADGDVAHVVLARPQALNALNIDMLDGLLSAIDASRDSSAIVIYGEGRAFCVGEDLKETLAPVTGEPDELRKSLDKLQQLTRSLTAFRHPVIAAVHGYAIGGGAELALSADFLIGSSDLQFRFPEVPIGHAVTNGITARLSATVGLVRAKDLLLTGRWIGAEEAHGIGMLTEINTDPISRSKELGRELGAMPWLSMGATKIGIELASIPHQEAVLNAEVDAAAVCFAGDEAAEAYASFQPSSARQGDTSP